MNSEQLPKFKTKLIFNPDAGATRRDKPTLPDILLELSKWQVEPDVCVLEGELDLARELKTALAQGVEVFTVCGGDGTISRVCDVLAGTDARVAIIPTGTHNNNAKSLNIPTALPECAALIRTGSAMRVDVGVVRCGGVVTHFLEIVSVGLASAVCESGDALQHGHITSIGAFLADLITCPPAQIRLTLDGQLRESDTGYVALVTNMPYCGFHYEFGHALCNRDGLLNVLYFSDLSKADLLKYIAQGIYLGKPEDPRIKHYLARTIDISAEPAMPVMADARVIGQGDVHIEVRERAIGFIVGKE